MTSRRSSGSRLVSRCASSRASSGSTTRRLVPSRTLAWLVVNGCGRSASAAAASRSAPGSSTTPSPTRSSRPAFSAAASPVRSSPSCASRSRQGPRTVPRRAAPPAGRWPRAAAGGRVAARVDDAALDHDQRGGRPARRPAPASAGRASWRPGPGAARHPAVSTVGAPRPGRVSSAADARPALRRAASRRSGRRCQPTRSTIRRRPRPRSGPAPRSARRRGGAAHRPGRAHPVEAASASRAPPGRSAASERRRRGIEHYGAPHGPAARVAQDHPVTDVEGDGPLQRQPAHLVAERPEPRAQAPPSRCAPADARAPGPRPRTLMSTSRPPATARRRPGRSRDVRHRAPDHPTAARRERLRRPGRSVARATRCPAPAPRRSRDGARRRPGSARRPGFRSPRCRPPAPGSVGPPRAARRRRPSASGGRRASVTRASRSASSPDPVRALTATTLRARE